MKISKSQLKQIILDEGLFANIRGAMSPEGEGQIEFDTSSPEFRELIYDLVQDVLTDMVESDPMFLRKMGKTVHDVALEPAYTRNDLADPLSESLLTPMLHR